MNPGNEFRKRTRGRIDHRALTVVLQATIEMVLGERGPERDLISVAEDLHLMLADLLAVDLQVG